MLQINKLRKELLDLKDNFGVVALKGGTEIEDLGFEEIGFIHQISENIVPLIIKIGGPEARNDMRNLFRLKVEGILAPMIESHYSFKNFAKTALELLKDYGIRPMLAINAETHTFYENMDKILNDPYFERIDSVTVGRGDLSASMEKDSVDDDEVTFVASEIIRAVREKGKITSVGGKVMPSNIYNIRENIKSHRANTRHVVMSLEQDNDLKEVCAKALLFEIKLYEKLMKVEPLKADAYKRRIEETKRRLSKDYAKAALIA